MERFLDFIRGIMKNGKFETQKEIFEALLAGDNITCTKEIGDYYQLSSLGFTVNHIGIRVNLCLDVPTNWSIYQEPKNKKTIEVKFYQYHYEVSSTFTKLIEISNWVNYSFIDFVTDLRNTATLGNHIFKLLKTEERIEIYEVEDG